MGYHCLENWLDPLLYECRQFRSHSFWHRWPRIRSRSLPVHDSCVPKITLLKSSFEILHGLRIDPYSNILNLLENSPSLSTSSPLKPQNPLVDHGQSRLDILSGFLLTDWGPVDTPYGPSSFLKSVCIYEAPLTCYRVHWSLSILQIHCCYK